MQTKMAAIYERTKTSRMVKDYCLCHHKPGLYFFPGNFDPASIRARLLLNYMVIFLIPSVVSNTKSVVFRCLRARAYGKPPSVTKFGSDYDCIPKRRVTV